MRNRAILLALASIGASMTWTVPATAQGAPAGPTRAFTGEDLFRISGATDPQISPDGTKIAYVRMTGDIMADRYLPSIWIIDVASGEQTPLVVGPGAHRGPRWSPDGKRLAYVSSDGGEGGSQIYILWLDSGEKFRVTGLPQQPGGLAWSPDGKSIAFSSDMPGEGLKLGSAPQKPEGAKWAKPLQVIDRLTFRRDGGGYVDPAFSQIFLVDASGGAPRQLTFGNLDSGGALSWTADSKTILFAADRSDNWQRNAIESEIYALDVASGAITALTSRVGPDANPVVSPDGKHVAYVGFDDRKRSTQNSQLYVMDIDGKNARSLTASLDRSIDSLDWADNATLAVSYDDKGETVVARVGLDGKLTPVASGLKAGSGLDRPYTGGSFSIAKTGAVAYTGGSPTRPADIYLSAKGKVTRLTALNETWLANKDLASVRKLPVTAPDGRAIDAWLVVPATRKPGERLPLILEIHGGPHSAYGPAFSTDNQLYAAHGYAVLYTNPRGSTSYGEEFAQLIDRAYPGDDYDDLMASVDAAIADGIADPNNLFVTGGSGGGVLTAWIVGKTDRFKGAATQKPVINWTSEVLTADLANYATYYWFDTEPWNDQANYWRRSPLSLVGNVKTPTLVVVGSDDYRTPVSESEQYYTALQLRGVPTALVKVPDASHGGFTARPSQSAAKASAILAWFDKWRTAP